MRDSLRILYCNCSYKDVIPEDVKGPVLAAAVASGADVLATPDLCAMVERRDGELARLAEARRLIVVACHPRAVKWLFHAAGVPLNEGNVEVLDMRAADAQAIIERLPGASPAPADAAAPPDLEATGDWVPWFPTIDYDRCANCKQCVSFCPFGVYTVSEADTVVVANPRSCKDNCPACARMCPEVAIIFPKCPDSPIDGSEVREEESQRRKAADLRERLAGGTLHGLLAERRARLQGRVARRDRPGGAPARDKGVHGTD